MDNSRALDSRSKPRKCGPRVKTGCITCKIRRVKCDEEKPYCQRCISTGRSCDGYALAQPRRRKRTSIRTYYAPVNDPSPTEVLCYWSTVRISQFFGPDSIWKHSLPRLAVSEPAIQYALVALRSAQEAFCRRSDDGQEVFALQAYNRAIQHLVRNYSPQSTRDIHIVLVVCALFVCLELIKGDVNVAIKHIHAGLKILRHQGCFTDDRLYPKLSDSTAGLLVDLVDLFSRLRVQSITFDPSLIPDGFPYFNVNIPWRGEDQYFFTLFEARDALFELYSCSAALIQAGMSARYHLDLAVSQYQIGRQIAYFNRAFDALIQEKGSAWSREETRLANTTKLQSLVIEIWTESCLFVNQTAIDAFEPEFERIVDIAEECVARSLIDRFQMDWGIIPIVHFAGVKCRNPRLRRRLLRVLGCQQWREGCYDSFMSYRVVHRQMSIEEQGIDFRQNPYAVPEEAIRIHNSLLTVFLEPVANTMCYRLSLISYPNGLHEAPVWRHEDIPATRPLPPYEELC